MSRAARNRLRGFRAPDEPAAEERVWEVVRAAYAQREPVPARRRSRWRLALAPALTVVAGVLVLSPAGARVGRIITHALGVSHAAPALSSLPSPGRLLISGPGGTWTAAADGSIRHLGDWRQASWSPRGLYVAVASGGRLAALDPRGNIRWAIARPLVSDPRWYSPSGYRIAYRSGGTLRVIAGDGTADHLLDTSVAPVAPAWRPGKALGPFDLAYVTAGGRLVVRDGDTGAVLWSATQAEAPRELMWSTDGRRLVVVSAHGARTYSATGAPAGTITLPQHASLTDAALSPAGTSLALVVNRDRVVIADHGRMRQLPAGAGVRDVSWSPDGRWVVVSWPAANQWVFVRVAGAPRIYAVSRIAQQFSTVSGSAQQFSPTGGGRAFPQLEGWCCTARGPAG